MLRNATTFLATTTVAVLVSAGFAQNPMHLPGPAGDTGPLAAAMAELLAANPGARAVQLDGRTTRVYGRALSVGPSALGSAEHFRVTHSRALGVEPGDLRLGGPFADGRTMQPIMYDRATGRYKFTGVYYGQFKSGIPVFGGRMVALVRHEANWPLVLVSTSLRDLGGFEVAQPPAGEPTAAAALTAAHAALGPAARVVGNPSWTIWAGLEDTPAAPTVAFQVIAEAGRRATGQFQSLLLVVDAATGQRLHQEDLIVHADITGVVEGLVTQNDAADICEPELPEPLPYIRVNLGKDFVYADAAGQFTLPYCCRDEVSLDAALHGLRFRVFNQAGPDAVLSVPITPPGPASFLFNEENPDEFSRAEVNAYLHANRARDFALIYNPSYPVVADQVEFPISVNIADSCNAFYSILDQSINFFAASTAKTGGDCPNTAFSSVVHHEYGHHLVQMGGSGQGRYGEGMSDCIDVLISDQPIMGFGFHSNCSQGIRNADNDFQYPCSGGIHFCGQLLSGCVWSTRNELQATHPGDYLDILAGLTINSILLHTGTSITPSITVDFLTLDDDDDDITNGTPHYDEIAAGFGAHNMDAPPLAALSFSFPNGRPSYVLPAGGTTLRVVVNGVTEVPQPGSAAFLVTVDGTTSAGQVTQVQPNVYDAVFPAHPCGALIEYYFTAQSTTSTAVSSPAGAPAATFIAISAAGAGPAVFSDPFEADLAWTVQDSPGLEDGTWERGVPAGDGSRGDPTVDADGSGQCYLTGNAPGNSDVDGGTTTLASPIMDASGSEKVLSYWRWYSNTSGSEPETDVFVVEVSSNGGASWVNLETVGPAGPEVDGGWRFKQFRVADYVPLTSQFRVRFLASDLGGGSIVEAAVDGVKLTPLACTALLGDLNFDKHVNGLDLAALLGQWTGAFSYTPCPPHAPADLNQDCRINGIDLALLLGAWTG